MGKTRFGRTRTVVRDEDEDEDSGEGQGHLVLWTKQLMKDEDTQEDDWEGQGHLEGAQGHSGGLGRIRTLGRDKEGQGGTRMLRKGMNYQKAQGQLEGWEWSGGQQP